VGRDEHCTDGLDNDLDGETDCYDTDCIGHASCVEDCADRVDNDGDTWVDCLDSDCLGHPDCDEDCTDGIDNDMDWLLDCEDGDCADYPACIEDCLDGVDNDGNALVDCDDSDCWNDPACYVTSTVLAGVMERQWTLVSASSWRNGSQTGNEVMRLQSVEGVMTVPLGSGQYTSCTWAADALVASHNSFHGSHASSFSSSFRWETSGLTVQSGCPLPAAAARPPTLIWGHVGATSVGEYHTYMTRGARWLGTPTFVGSSFTSTSWQTDMSTARVQSRTKTWAGPAIGYQAGWSY
jgi:hypothetical protein